MEIVFVRHTSVDVPKGMCYGRSDVATASTFEAEAETVKLQLDLLDSPEAIFTSPLSRCTKLAAYCGYPDAVRDDRLLELNFGDWELRYFDEIDDPQLQRWYDDYLYVAPTNGEAFPEQLQRVKEFIEEMKTRGFGRITVFAHGGVLLCAMIIAGALSPEEAMSSIPPYGSVLRLEF
ncbi:MAG: alpha-ribazole phosphatase family protein [Paramuribaculum sp.]|nr:alpha-ribazole phosphatase family protein [Paramuribaculum sp.]